MSYIYTCITGSTEDRAKDGQVPDGDGLQLSLGAILGILVVLVLILAVLIDLTCCRVNYIGTTYFSAIGSDGPCPLAAMVNNNKNTHLGTDIRGVTSNQFVGTKDPVESGTLFGTPKVRNRDF